MGSVQCTCKHRAHPLTSRLPHHPQRWKQRPLKPWGFFWIRLRISLEQAFLSSLWVFNPSPLLLPCYHGEDNTKLCDRPSYHYPLALPFPSNTMNISALGLPYQFVYWPPSPAWHNSHVLIALFPEASRGVPWVEVLPWDIMRVLRVQPWYEGAGHSHGNPGSSFCFPWSRSFRLCTVSRVVGRGQRQEAGPREERGEEVLGR